jgi:hypothetical protein
MRHHTADVETDVEIFQPYAAPYAALYCYMLKNGVIGRSCVVDEAMIPSRVMCVFQRDLSSKNAEKRVQLPAYRAGLVSYLI